eukprot:c9448_g1_i3.p2 GENE.c9448_g1_i3~~c9448_g1_i3.p2  ORF type:complete len:136 (+),score=43.43 c9448_g1_i3:151-558(+)
MLSKKRFADLLKEICPEAKMDGEVEQALSEIADEFIESVTTHACQLARHRNSDILEARDIQLHLGVCSLLLRFLSLLVVSLCACACICVLVLVRVLLAASTRYSIKCTHQPTIPQTPTTMNNNIAQQYKTRHQQH